MFLQNIEHLPARPPRTVRGTPESNPELVEGISADRDLPALGPALPARGAPMVLYSRAGKTLYIVGRTDADIAAAERTFEALRAKAR